MRRLSPCLFYSNETFVGFWGLESRALFRKRSLRNYRAVTDGPTALTLCLTVCACGCFLLQHYQGSTIQLAHHIFIGTNRDILTKGKAM